MADTIRQKLSFSKETSWGETPSTPTLKDLNFTTNSLAANKTTIKDQTIRPDGQSYKSAMVGFGTTGNIASNLRVGEMLPFYANVLQSADLTTAAYDVSDFAGTVGLVSASSKITFAEVADYNLFKNETVIKVTGSATSGNNKIYTVVSTNDVAREIVVGEAIVSDDDTATTAGLTFTKGSIVNGTTDGSFLIEVANTAIGKFKASTGCKFGSFEIGITSREFITETFNLIGKDLTVGNATLGSGTNTAASTATAVNASSNVYKMFVDTGELQARVTSLSLNVARETRERPYVGSLYTSNPGRNQLAVSGNLSIYFENYDLYQKFLDHTTVALKLVIKDVSGNVFAVELPAITLQSVTDDNGGLDQDIMLDFAIDGFGDTTKGYTVKVSQLNA